jgi:hypothetical protein
MKQAEVRERALEEAQQASSARADQLEKEGAFKRSDKRGIAFATGRLSAGAQAARDLIVDAWLASANAPVGYPMVNVGDIESGKVRATRELFGAD